MMFYVTAFSKVWLRRKVLGVCLEFREENRPLSGQQHQAQFGINPALNVVKFSLANYKILCLKTDC